jgi:hypothetical protein
MGVVSSFKKTVISMKANGLKVKKAEVENHMKNY